MVSCSDCALHLGTVGILQQLLQTKDKEIKELKAEPSTMKVENDVYSENKALKQEMTKLTEQFEVTLRENEQLRAQLVTTKNGKSADSRKRESLVHLDSSESDTEPLQLKRQKQSLASPSVSASKTHPLPTPSPSTQASLRAQLMAITSPERQRSDPTKRPPSTPEPSTALSPQYQSAGRSKPASPFKTWMNENGLESCSGVYPLKTDRVSTDISRSFVQGLLFESVSISLPIDESWLQVANTQQCLHLYQNPDKSALVWADGEDLQHSACRWCTLTGRLCVYVDFKALRVRALHEKLRRGITCDAVEFWVLPPQKRKRMYGLTRTSVAHPADVK